MQPLWRAWTTRFWRVVGWRWRPDALMGRRSASTMSARRNDWGGEAFDDALGDGGAVVEGAAVAADVDDEFGVDGADAAGDDGVEGVGALLGEGGHRLAAGAGVGLVHDGGVDRRDDRAGTRGGEGGAEPDEPVGVGVPAQPFVLAVALFGFVVGFGSGEVARDRAAQLPGGVALRERAQIELIRGSRGAYEHADFAVGQFPGGEPGPDLGELAEAVADLEPFAGGADLGVERGGEPMRGGARLKRPVPRQIERDQKVDHLVHPPAELARRGQDLIAQRRHI